ncbi:MAG: LysR family transcriptional regulator [Pseudomonadota bacterium]
MNTDALRLFVLAAEKLNISAAGRALGLAPAVSSAKLAKLERIVGADLLHRSTRKVSLSLEGAGFLPYAREIIAQEDAGLAVLGKGKPEVGGTVRFTAPSTFAQLYLAPLLPKFLDAYPGITLDLRLSDASFDLIEGSFDLALRNMKLEPSSLIGRKLAEDTRVLCASQDYVDRYGAPCHPDELSGHRLIAFKSTIARPLTGPRHETSMFDPLQAARYLIIDDGLSQKLATMKGAGISINSVWSVHEELADGRLVRILPGWSQVDQTALWLVYPKANVLSAKVRVLMDFLLREIDGGAAWKAGVT